MLYGNQLLLRGMSGRDYGYVAEGLFANWLAVPANYLFAHVAPSLGLGWTVLYAGEAEDMKERMARHDRLWEAIGLGATHILSRQNYGGVDARRAEERDLIGLHNPPMNVQHRTNAFAGGGIGFPPSRNAFAQGGISLFSDFGSLGPVLDPKR